DIPRRADLGDRLAREEMIVVVIVGHEDDTRAAGVSAHEAGGNHSERKRELQAPRSSRGRTAGSVTTKRAPSPGRPSARITPPWRSTMRRQIARPTPVPSYSPRAWRRW